MKKYSQGYVPKPDKDIVRQNIQRRCLKCLKVFMTDDIGIRMCNPCKGKKP